MLYALIEGVRRPPIEKKERAVCPSCGSIVIAVVPTEKVKHWRHRESDCDSWSEPEGEWHVSWKENFQPECREVTFTDQITGERHRADIFCGANTDYATVLELQHSHISEDERLAREKFYMEQGKMFWLVHIHNQHAMNESNLHLSMHCSSKVSVYKDREFRVMTWLGSSMNFIEKWKRSSAHVFFDFRGEIYYLATERFLEHFDYPFFRGDFAICHLSKSEFLNAVLGIKAESEIKNGG